MLYSVDTPGKPNITKWFVKTYGEQLFPVVSKGGGGEVMSCLRYLCLFANSGVQHILCCVFVLFVSVLCTLYCQFLWIVHLWLPLRYSLAFICFVCLRLVYPKVPVSLDCPSLIGPTVFSNVYLFCLSSSCVPYVASFSGLSIFDWPYGIL